MYIYTLESPTAGRSKPVNPKGNQLWIFIGRTDAEAETQYFGHLMRRADLLEKTLMLGKIEGRRRRGWQRMRRLDSISDWMDMRQWRRWKSDMLQSMGSQRVGHDLVTEQQQMPFFNGFVEKDNCILISASNFSLLRYLPCCLWKTQVYNCERVVKRK